ncbi:MAG: glycosyltransferase family 1 protein [Cyclobacteriaceae bacterium]|nr:MAG: glycosyltransferase family 1 protein [Cyclobacteriaceae bacterium]
MRILFYTPLNTRCRDIESQAEFFANNGHTIFLLTQSKPGALHGNFSAYGYQTSADESSSRFTSVRVVRRMVKLIGFCSSNRIDLVYAHLEPCNFIAVLSQYFVRARVIICRHHVDEAKLYPFGKDLSYKLTYRLAKEIIVVSSHAKRYMVREENVPESRITHINLAYNFDLYELPSSEKVKRLRDDLEADLVLLSVCRLTRYKRPELSVEVLKNLLAKGLSVKLIILGRGELQQELEEKIEKLNLRQHCLLPVYVNNVLEYMAAADVLIHPSLLESSCITVKEAGLVNLPVIVCRNIGDFNEVIEHGVNGFIVDADNFVEETSALLLKYCGDRSKLLATAYQLRQTVYKLFDIAKVGPAYEELFHKQSS